MLRDTLRSRTSQEVKVKNASKDVVLEVLLTFGSLVDHNIHTVGVGEEDTMAVSRCAVVEVDWMVTV